MRRIAFLAVLTLTGCDSSTWTNDASTPPGVAAVTPPQLPSNDTRLDCEKAGGEWKAWCVPNTPSCVMPWPDAGKQCTDSSQCESRMCMVDLSVTCTGENECQDPPFIPRPGELAMGICKREDVSCGSYIEIRHGLAQEPYHVD